MSRRAAILLLGWLGGALASAQTVPAPEGLVARSGDRSITLHWEPTGGMRDEYLVFRANEPEGPYTPRTQAPLLIRSFADTEVTNGQPHFYRVQTLRGSAKSELSAPIRVEPRPFEDDNDFLNYLQATAFDYFWFEANPKNGLIKDRTKPGAPCSIAAVGFGLTALGIGIDHGWITRDQGRARALRTLETFYKLPQGPEEEGTAGYRGWFYHFLNMETGERVWECELSSVDTGLLMMGVLYAREYFDQRHQDEARIRELADRLFARIDWRWMMNEGPTLTMGWRPERGFIRARWEGYNEASFLYLLGLGAETEPLPESVWEAWTGSYKWETLYGQSFVPFPPLFGHQYTACWIDLRYSADEFMREKGITYFENSRRATLAQQAYAMANPGEFKGYGKLVWGLTACDGPRGYGARGTPPPENDDGTIAPTAAGGSLPFAPEETVATLRHFYDEYRTKLWCGYGFRDAFNLTQDWWATDVIGIDQGPILLMAENLRTGHVWQVMRKNEILRRGMKRAGFEAISPSN